MTIFNRCLSAATAVLIATLAMPCPAQFGGRGGGGFGGSGRGVHTRNVVLSHTDGLPDPMMRLVANEMVQSGRKNRGEESIGDLLGVYLSPAFDGGGFGDGVDERQALIIRSLRIQVHVTEEPYDDEMLEQRWDEARQKLQYALRSAQRRITRQREESRSAARDALARRRASLENDLVIFTNDLENEVGDGGSPEQLREQFDETMSMLRELALDRVGVQARRQAIEQRIDELRKMADATSESDPMIAELLKIQEIRQQQLEIVRHFHSTGKSSESDLRNAESDVAHARSEVLKAQRAAVEQASGSVLRELNNELSSLIVRLAEIDARTQAIEPRAHELREQTSVGATAQRAALEQKLATLQDAIARLDAKQTELDGEETTVGESITITPLDEALGLGIEEAEAE